MKLWGILTMHYEIFNEIVVKSENAAKSYTQPNKTLINLLDKFKGTRVALDYGCGKARYTLSLCKIAKKVVAIDSIVQLSRKQIIWGESTTLIEWAKKIQNLSVLSIEDFVWEDEQYDFILNSNVLSAIPDDVNRLMVLHNIKKALNFDGRALITTQYRNSYFSSYNSNPNAITYNDGWLVRKNDYYSFYGLIDRSKLQKYFEIVGLSVADTLLHDGSAFMIVKK